MRRLTLKGLAQLAFKFRGKSGAPRHRGEQYPRMIRRPWFVRRYPVPVLLACVLLATGAWIWSFGLLAAITGWAGGGLLALSADAGLYVGEVYLEGREETPREEIVSLLGINRGQPILGFSPRVARQRLEALPWVRSASVSRHLPDTIYIRLEERTPFAIWQHDGRLVVIDREGAEITGVDAAPYGHLPFIVGTDAPGNAAGLVEMLAAEPVLARRVTAAVRIGGRRWDLRLDDAVDVKLPEQDPAAAWARLAALEQDHGLLAREVVVVDLRLPDRLVVRLPEDSVALTKPGAKTAIESRGHET